MPSLLIALAATAAAALASREAVRVARLSTALGAGAALLTATWLACAIGSGFAAWLGSQVAAWLAPGASAILFAVTLLIAAGELTLLQPGRAPAEPTRSFGAIVIVLVAAQLTSAAGLLVFAIAANSVEPELTAIGGTLGSGAVLTAAWRARSDWEARVPLVALRWIGAGLLLLAAIAIGLSAQG